jgi:hypothetical protein
MDDFHETYKTYSNKELIKIVEQPQLYQPSAVDAARSILSHRQPTEFDFEEAFQYRYIDPLLQLLAVAIHAGVLGVFLKSEMRQYFGGKDVNIVSFLVKCVVICVMIAIVVMYSTA